MPRDGPILLPVVGLHDLARDVAAGADAGVALAPRGVVEQLADAVPVAPRVPVHVVLAVPVGIDDGDKLQVGPRRPCRCSPAAAPACRSPPARAAPCRSARCSRARPARGAARSSAPSRAAKAGRETCGDSLGSWRSPGCASRTAARSCASIRPAVIRSEVIHDRDVTSRVLPENRRRRRAGRPAGRRRHPAEGRSAGPAHRQPDVSPSRDDQGRQLRRAREDAGRASASRRSSCARRSATRSSPACPMRGW